MTLRGLRQNNVRLDRLRDAIKDGAEDDFDDILDDDDGGDVFGLGDGGY